MKKLALVLVVLSIALMSCEKEADLNSNPVLSPSYKFHLFYKIEHEEGQYGYPVNPLGVVTTEQGYKFEILNGESIYIKDSTELDFWTGSDSVRTWHLEQLDNGYGSGGMIIDNQTLKLNFWFPGEYRLTIVQADTFRIKIFCH